MVRYYKGVRVNSFGLPVFRDQKGDRIKRHNRKRAFYHPKFSSPFTEDAPKNLIVMYDIPHQQKKERDWFRRQLQSYGFIMVQRSVWVGPSPLPKQFLLYLKAIKIDTYFKTFKLAKSYRGMKREI